MPLTSSHSSLDCRVSKIRGGARVLGRLSCPLYTFVVAGLDLVYVATVYTWPLHALDLGERSGAQAHFKGSLRIQLKNWVASDRKGVCQSNNMGPAT